MITRRRISKSLTPFNITPLIAPDGFNPEIHTGGFNLVDSFNKAGVVNKKYAYMLSDELDTHVLPNLNGSFYVYEDIEGVNSVRTYNSTYLSTYVNAGNYTELPVNSTTSLPSNGTVMINDSTVFVYHSKTATHLIGYSQTLPNVTTTTPVVPVIAMTSGSIHRHVIVSGTFTSAWCTRDAIWLFIGLCSGSFCYNNSSLKYVHIDSELSELTYRNFASCSALDGKLNLPENIKIIPDGTFQNSSIAGEIIFPDQVESIGNNAFWSAKNITSLKFSKSINHIGDSSFYNCSSIESIIIESTNVSYVGTDAFYGMRKVNSISIGDNIQNLSLLNNVLYFNYSAINKCLLSTINNNSNNLTIKQGTTEICSTAFNGCKLLTGILSLPDTISTIGSHAFYECIGINKMVFNPLNLVTIGISAFRYCLFNWDLSLSETIKSIGSYCFQNCNQVTGQLKIPSKMTIVEAYSFYACSEITNINTGINTVTINSYALALIGSVDSIIFHSKLKTIGDSCFYGTSPSIVYCYASIPPTSSDRAFSGIQSNTPIHLPAGTKSAYQAAPGWSKFTNIIEDL